MSDVFEPELNQDFVGDDSMNTSVAAPVEDNKPKKEGMLSFGIFNVMLLISLIFIILATLNLLGVLRTYSDSFPFGGGVPWSPNV